MLVFYFLSKTYKKSQFYGICYTTIVIFTWKLVRSLLIYREQSVPKIQTKNMRHPVVLRFIANNRTFLVRSNFYRFLCPSVHPSGVHASVIIQSKGKEQWYDHFLVEGLVPFLRNTSFPEI